jgi:GMP synthase-like glutamine amidotransferase
MSHGDQVAELAPGFISTASSATCPNAASMNEEKQIYTVQFHPEASAGPQDTGTLFDSFMHMMTDGMFS